LLLRIALGPGAIAEGVLYLSRASPYHWPLGIIGLALIAGGAALTIGFLTPVAGTVIALHFLALALAWLPTPSSNLQDIKLISFAAITMSVALSLIGPGAFSLDGYLFGRREIIIPPSGASKPL